MKAIEHTPTRQGQETQLPLMLEMPRGIFARIRELVRRSLDRELHAQMLLHDLPLLFDTERLEQRLRPLLTRAKEGQSVRIPATILSPFVKSGLPPKAARIARAIPRQWSTIVIPIQDGKFLFGGIDFNAKQERNRKMEDRKFWMVALPIVWAFNIAGAAFAAWVWFGW